MFFEYFVALRCFFNFFTGTSEHMVSLRSGVERQECVGGFIFMLCDLYELLHWYISTYLYMVQMDRVLHVVCFYVLATVGN